MVIINKIIDSRCYERILFLIFKRHLRKSVIRSCEKDLQQNVKPKGKITIIKRKLTSIDEGDNILEWKSAASVIKKINFENKHLFGPVLTSNSPNARNSVKILETNKIIQHKTLIPIIEPLVQQNIEKAGSEGYQSVQEVDLNSIVAFPLQNKSGRSDNEVNKLNLLRRNLECLSKDKIPSVSMILQKTMPEERVKNLDRWKQNMIKQLGEEGFQKYHTALLDNGASLHSNISSFLSSTPESELIIKEENIGHWRSLRQVLQNVNDVKLLEEYVTHPFLCYRGIVDCFAKYR